MPGKYRGGRIFRIKVKNFMTYDNLELFPEQGLNMIIGPNGSGKSSIMCAICLGLGGKSAFTGRNLRLSDYIKHGCDTARILIELDDPESKERSLVITRKIQQCGPSVFKINDKVVKESEVEKQVKRFNIRVNNLCQFLPQEKVSEFSKMSSKQLLESMQQAVGDENMHKLYQELIRLRSDTQRLEEDFKTRKEIIEKEKQKNERLQPEVQVYEDRQKFMKKIELMEEKRPVLEYQILYARANAQKAEWNQAKAVLSAFKEGQIDPLENEYDFLKKETWRYKNHITSEDAKFEKTAGLVQKSQSTIKDIDNKIYDEKEAFSNKVTEQQTQEQKRKELEVQIAAYEENYKKGLTTKQKMEEEQIAIEPQSKEVTMKFVDINSACEAKDSEIQEWGLQKKRLLEQLRQLNDRENRKLEYLKTHNKDTYIALCWLNENRHLFRRNIIGPLLMLIKVPDSRNMKFLETHISYRDMVLFLCEDKDDAKLFTRILRAEKKLAVNAACVPSRAVSEFKPRIPEAHLKSYRFQAYLKDLFEAPDAVVAFLCENYNIHNTPVGSIETEEFVHANLSAIPFARFYTPDVSYAVKKSKYGSGNISCSTSQIGDRGMLSLFASTSNDQIRMAEGELVNVETKLAELKAEKDALDNEKAELVQRVNEFRKKKQELINFKEMLKKEEVKIRNKKETLRNMEQRQIDLRAEKTKMISAISALKQKKIAEFNDLYIHLQDQIKIVSNKTYVRYFEMTCSVRISAVDRALRENNGKLTELQQDCSEKENIYTDTKATLKKQLNLVERKCGIRLNDSAGVAKFNKKYGNLPSDLKTLDQELNCLKAKVDCMGDTDQMVIQDHEKRARMIQYEEQELQKLSAQLENLKSEMRTKKQAWFEPLEALIQKISKTFSEYFESLGCAGEICLNKGENEDDFGTYGLSIQVKYRENAPLRELSQAHHSGGECSVATIIFILSLQELVEVPFRCVDEINQGMDSVNERRIFELLSSSAEKSSQYFLLTPKLLPDLPYSSNMKIHIIYNGPALRFTDWDLDAIFERNREYEETEN